MLVNSRSVTIDYVVVAGILVKCGTFRLKCGTFWLSKRQSLWEKLGEDIVLVIAGESKVNSYSDQL